MPSSSPPGPSAHVNGAEPVPTGATVGAEQRAITACESVEFLAEIRVLPSDDSPNHPDHVTKTPVLNGIPLDPDKDPAPPDHGSPGVQVVSTVQMSPIPADDSNGIATPNEHLVMDQIGESPVPEEGKVDGLGSPPTASSGGGINGGGPLRFSKRVAATKRKDLNEEQLFKAAMHYDPPYKRLCFNAPNHNPRSEVGKLNQGTAIVPTSMDPDEVRRERLSLMERIEPLQRELGAEEAKLLLLKKLALCQKRANVPPPPGNPFLPPLSAGPGSRYPPLPPFLPNLLEGGGGDHGSAASLKAATMMMMMLSGGANAPPMHTVFPPHPITIPPHSSSFKGATATTTKVEVNKHLQHSNQGTNTNQPRVHVAPNGPHHNSVAARSLLTGQHHYVSASPSSTNLLNKIGSPLVSSTIASPYPSFSNPSSNPLSQAKQNQAPSYSPVVANNVKVDTLSLGTGKKVCPSPAPQQSQSFGANLKQQQAAAKLALRKQLEKTLLQIPPPKPPPPEINFVPNGANTNIFIYLSGIEAVARSILTFKRHSKKHPNPTSAYLMMGNVWPTAAPYKCAQCGTDFSPVWQQQGTTNKKTKDKGIEVKVEASLEREQAKSDGVEASKAHDDKVVNKSLSPVGEGELVDRGIEATLDKGTGSKVTKKELRAMYDLTPPVTVICETCATANQKRSLKAEHTARLKAAFVKALQQEQEIEKQMVQQHHNSSSQSYASNGISSNLTPVATPPLSTVNKSSKSMASHGLQQQLPASQTTLNSNLNYHNASLNKAIATPALNSHPNKSKAQHLSSASSSSTPTNLQYRNSQAMLHPHFPQSAPIDFPKFLGMNMNLAKLAAAQSSLHHQGYSPKYPKDNQANLNFVASLAANKGAALFPFPPHTNHPFYNSIPQPNNPKFSAGSNSRSTSSSNSQKFGGLGGQPFTTPPSMYTLHHFNNNLNNSAPAEIGSRKAAKNSARPYAGNSQQQQQQHLWEQERALNFLSSALGKAAAIAAANNGSKASGGQPPNLSPGVINSLDSHQRQYLLDLIPPSASKSNS